MQKTKKQVAEEQFHDKYALNTKLEEINVFENFSFAAQENRYALKLFGNLMGKTILDLGCGFGETAVFWAKKGALVEAVDISSASIEIAKKLAKKHKVSKNCRFQTMVSEDLKFKKEYFDFVFGNGVLHHIDLDKSAPQISRVLKRNGQAIFVEPLAYNPIINIYRDIAQDVRTPTESPLTFSKINKLKKHFKSVNHREFELLTLLIFLWFYLASRVNPNKERYWRKFLKTRGRLRNALKVLISADNVILKLLPPLRYLCWNTVIMAKK